MDKGLPKELIELQNELFWLIESGDDEIKLTNGEKVQLRKYLQFYHEVKEKNGDKSWGDGEILYALGEWRQSYGISRGDYEYWNNYLKKGKEIENYFIKVREKCILL